MLKSLTVAIVLAGVLTATPAHATTDIPIVAKEDGNDALDAHAERKAVEIWTTAETAYWQGVKKWVNALQKPTLTHTTRRSTSASAPSASDGSGRHYSCPQFASGDNPTGDFAIPCGYIDRESDGNYAADNPNSSAYGAYQILHLPPGTSPAEQDAIARGMALCNWQPPNYCAGN